ncbi:hypothetical protein ERO13_D05G260150v2 [Gossypium hirsutum]|uniref:Knottin scorpion toxin-like domain-containing protein n=5 Tax=Gossypium TaxID=3633 RepID=A0A0D2QP07_GOSRA|nr:hypothetical protein ES319_D05G271400v1 [Gossypium barbadense]KAG4148016.1 hypothetical protein ERO13_D05G260150v2 [Gossypium hirsutum]KJB59787.1 hypothetical protein B456_009G272000 [Gossypium raimondii]TYG70105.1 hypothetical protein ES288_D05G285700v1 [Gossypium darwinii]TYH72862.1 hypothetical protein ES332_D05G285700v1 [Gossypium tomentosum]TYI83224.1 hypothetical protein E1A91_D05G277700v1 [Gossypium mustelinum]
MAKLLGPLPNYTFIFLSFLLLVYSGTQMVEAQVCSRPSQTTGVITCPSNLLCDRRCRDIEGAMYGACQPRLLGSTCLCYVRC